MMLLYDARLSMKFMLYVTKKVHEVTYEMQLSELRNEARLTDDH